MYLQLGETIREPEDAVKTNVEDKQTSGSSEEDQQEGHSEFNKMEFAEMLEGDNLDQESGQKEGAEEGIGDKGEDKATQPISLA